MMRELLRRLSAGQLFFIVLVPVLMGAVLLAGWRFGSPGALVAAAMEALLLWLSRAIWAPTGAGATRVRIYSIAAAVTLAAGQPLLPQIINALTASPEVLHWIPALKGIHLDEEPSPVQLLLVLAAIVAVNYFMARPTAPVQADKAFEDLPRLDYEQRRQGFVGHLAQEIRAIDFELSWSAMNFVPVEAEVEDISTMSGTGKKIVSLLASLRKSRDDRVILVVGDPGSGKSVALRKLCLELLGEVAHGGRVPIYINLREWLPAPTKDGAQGQRWTPEMPPSAEELERFVRQQLLRPADVFVTEFINDYFRRMVEHGKVLFVFDSFDEIPQLIDNVEDGWLIDKLSATLRRFIGANGRGIVASRLYRRPTPQLQASRSFEIRPFSDVQIDASLQRFRQLSEATRRQIFRERNDLVSLARNPFLGSLLGARFESRQDLPSSQVALFEDYLGDRVDRCAERMSELAINREQVFAVAVEIAFQLFTSPRYGLELPVGEISSSHGPALVERVVDLLTYARIGRVGAGRERLFSFVHRRMHEYFVVRHFIEEQSDLPFADIPSDSRGRDAMVLYAQVAPREQALQLLSFAWQGARENDSLIARLHCLRFMHEAFVFRKGLVQEMVGDELLAFVQHGVESGADLLVRKHSLESAGLLDAAQLQAVLMVAIRSSNRWLQETAFRSCKQLPMLASELEAALITFLMRFDPFQILRSRKELLFALSLSEAMKRVSLAFRIRVFESAVVLTVPMIFALWLAWLVPRAGMVLSAILLLTYLMPRKWMSTALRIGGFYCALMLGIVVLSSERALLSSITLGTLVLVLLPLSFFYYGWRIFLRTVPWIGVWGAWLSLACLQHSASSWIKATASSSSAASNTCRLHLQHS